MLLTVASGANVLALNVLAAVSGVGFAVVTQFVISVNSAVKNFVEFLSDHDDSQQPHHHVQGRPGDLLQGPDTRLVQKNDLHDLNTETKWTVQY